MKLRAIQLRSLKAKVTLTTLVIVLLGIWSLAFFVSKSLREDMQRLLGDQQQATVALVASSINSDLRERMDALTAVAGKIDSNLLKDPATLQKFVEQRPGFQTLFNAGVFVTRIDGVAIAEFPPMGRVGLNYVDRDHVAAALTEGKTTVGKPTIGKRVRAASFAISVPIVDLQGKVNGAITGATDLSKPNFLEEISQSSYGQSGGYLVVDPKSRLFVTATANNHNRVMQPIPAPGVNAVLDRRLLGFDGSAVNINSQGIEVLTSSARIPTAGWFVIATLPTQEAFAPISSMMERTAIATILLTLLTTALAWWLLNRQLEPVQTTIKTLSILAESSSYPQPLAITRKDEIGDMIAAFNRLLSTLGSRDEALRQSEQYARAIIEASPVPLAINDDKGNITYLNQAFLQTVGYALTDIPDLNEWRSRAYPDSQYRQSVKDKWRAHWDEARLTGEPFAPLEVNIRCKDDSIRTFACSAASLEDSVAGSVLVVMQDITDQVRSAEKIMTLLREQKAILNNELVGIVTVRDRRIIWANPALEHMLGFKSGELEGTPTRQNYPSDEAFQSFGAAAYPVLAAGNVFRTQVEHVCKDGRHIWVDISGEMLDQQTGQSLWGLIDITQRKQLEDQVRQLAFHDPLTGLPNRRLLTDRMTQAMAAGTRSGSFSALIYLDLDNFKPLNDEHGHGAGDLLLKEVALRLTNCVRAVDTVSRIGGDEFVVLLNGLSRDQAHSAEQANKLAEKICVALARPYVLAGGKESETIEHHCSASIGVVLFGKQHKDLENILKWADATMYLSKAQGRNRVTCMVERRAQQRV
jgi:diguanylate cyclase (GGDEF)-like protein/PAS domain S-box-containing protein